MEGQTKGRNRNMFQAKNKTQPLKKDLHDTEISNLPDREFKVRGNKDTHRTQEKNGWTHWDLQQRDWNHKKVPSWSRKAEEYKTKQKNTAERLIQQKTGRSRIQITDLEDTAMLFTQAKWQNKKIILKVKIT